MSDDDDDDDDDDEDDDGTTSGGGALADALLAAAALAISESIANASVSPALPDTGDDEFRSDATALFHFGDQASCRRTEPCLARLIKADRCAKETTPASEVNLNEPSGPEEMSTNDPNGAYRPA